MLHGERSKPLRNEQVIQTLFPNYTAAQIRECLINSEPLISHGDVSRLAQLHELVNTPPLNVLSHAHADNRLIAHTRAQDGSTAQNRVSSEIAAMMYREGASITAEDFDTFYLNPIYGEFLDELRVGTGAKRVASVYVASPVGEALPLHFDSVDVIVVQLQGTKRWRLAANYDVVHPDASYFHGLGAGERDAHPSRVAPDYFPMQWSYENGSQNFKAVDLYAGSALLVPRGYWHETTCLKESVSLTLRLSNDHSGTLVDTVYDQFVKSKLRGLPEMRLSLWDMYTRADAAEEYAREALSSLKALVEELDEVAVCQGILGTRWCRPSGVRGELYFDVAGCVLHVSKGTSEHVLSVPDKLADFIQWLLATEVLYDTQLHHASLSHLQYRGVPISPELFPALVDIGLFVQCPLNGREKKRHQ